jgi:hypothetical protein
MSRPPHSRGVPAGQSQSLSGIPPAYGRSDLTPRGGGPANLADILERVLDKGIVIAGDIQINLLDIELLTIKLRLLIASVDRAQEMGINWWESDPNLSTDAKELERENEDLKRRLDRVERMLGGLAAGEKGRSEAAEGSETKRVESKDDNGGGS